MAQFALVMRRYMHEYGVGPEPFAHVAATIRNHGHVNPEAVMFGAGPYTAADVLASPLIAAPLHRLECALVAEGACALVMTTLERARDLHHNPVLVLGGGMEFHGAAYANPPLLSKMGLMGQLAVTRTFATAQANPEDVDVFCLHFLEQALAEVRAGHTKTWSEFEVPENAIGCGFTEAVRGVLSHHMVIRDGKIANYHPYPPTPWNAAPRDSFGTAGPYVDAVQGQPIFEENPPEKFKGIDIMRTVRSFDPCLPCGVHMYLGDGRVLERHHSPAGMPVTDDGAG
jgi:hypothetical protein